MILNSEQYLFDFRHALQEFLADKKSLTDLEDAWGSRTSFYKQTLFPELAKKMDLHYESELLAVDYCLSQTAKNGYNVPVIFIESENNIESIEREIIKLCALSAPLKILFLCCDWKECYEVSFQKKDMHWNYILNAYSEFSALTGYFSVFVFEWNQGGLKVINFTYGQDGSLIKDQDVVFS